MAERFGLGNGPHTLNIGKSFTGSKVQNGGQNPKYHTIRYDFKPASVDPSKAGRVEIDESNSVSVSVPHMDSSNETKYSGHIKKSTEKECVLIIDKNTGEITIEKLSGNMLMKKTRPDRGGGSNEIAMAKPPPSSSTQRSSGSRPATPTSFPKSKEGSHSRSSSPHMGVSSTSNPAKSSNSIPTKGSSSKSGGKQKPKGKQFTSVPTVSSTTATPATTTTLNQVAKSQIDLSESSSSSSSSDSDSDSDMETVPTFGSTSSAAKSNPAAVAPAASMPSFLDSPSVTKSQQPSRNLAENQPQSIQTLTDDLQLSESDEDSSD